MSIDILTGVIPFNNNVRRLSWAYKWRKRFGYAPVVPDRFKILSCATCGRPVWVPSEYAGDIEPDDARCLKHLRK